MSREHIQSRSHALNQGNVRIMRPLGGSAPSHHGGGTYHMQPVAGPWLYLYSFSLTHKDSQGTEIAKCIGHKEPIPHDYSEPRKFKSPGGLVALHIVQTHPGPKNRRRRVASDSPGHLECHDSRIYHYHISK
eukprot:748108-Hanusia_phi.AAC.4